MKKKTRPVPVVEDDEEVAAAPVLRVPDASAMRTRINKLLKLSTFTPEVHYWLDTGSPELNETLGSRTHGIPYGKIVEISGKAHGGKTALTLVLAGLAQRDGAAVIYVDAENSADAKWCEKLGLSVGEDFNQIYLIQPKLVSDKATPKAEDWRLQSAEEMFDEAEKAMSNLHAQGFEKVFVMVDSIANLVTARVIEAGTAGQNMRTNSDRSMFLSSALPKWAGMAANYNALVVLINQIRTKPGVAFGDPTYTPGGNSLEHNCAVRAACRRAKNGKLRSGQTVIGLVGIMTNKKNKAGEGSMQDKDCGYKIRWDRSPAQVEFMSRTEAEGDLKANAAEEE